MQFYCDSGQRMYNDVYMTLFNVVFTATAPLVVGWFDRDLDKGYGTRYPLLYREGAFDGGAAASAGGSASLFAAGSAGSAATSSPSQISLLVA